MHQMKNNKRLIGYILLLFTCHASFAQNIDINILKQINKNETGFKNTYAEINSASVDVVIIAAPVGIAITGLISHDKKLLQDALYMGGSVLLTTGLTYTIKNIVNRKRPFYEYPFIVKRDKASYWLSFPSGHTSAAFCTATTLAIRYRKWYIIAPAYIYAAGVGWARMYQGVHYPSDVLAGAIIGTGCAWLGYKAQKWIAGKKERKKKVTL